MRMLKSKTGEVQTEKYWRDYALKFWTWAEGQNCYFTSHVEAKFKRPVDYFERMSKILQLSEVNTEISYKGVF